MSSDAIAWAPAQDCPNPTAKAVLKAMAPWVDPRDHVWVSVDLIATDIQKSVRSVQRGLADLRAAGLLIDTGEWEVFEGKRFPIYRMPLDQGFANLRQRMQAERRGDTHVTPKGKSGVTPMSPQNAWGDTHDTPRGDTHVTQVERDRNTFESSSELSQGAGERDDRFDEGFEAYPTSGQDRTHVPAARSLWAAAADEVGAETMVAAVRRYAAEDRDLRKGDHGAPGFERWLEGERWRRWLPKAAAPAAAPPERIPFAGDLGVLALVARIVGGDQADDLLQGCQWREADRAILAPTKWRAGKLDEALPFAWRTKHDIRIKFEGAKP